MKIISYNVNGIRAAAKKGLFEWVQEEMPDVLCLQEVKAMQEQIDLTPLIDLGYHVNWHHAEKKGYSGVATFSLSKPKKVIVGISNEKYDREGRILRTDIGPLSILNCYFPSGTTGGIRQDFKFEFLNDFYDWVKEIKKTTSNLIVVGDYNIAHQEIDIHNPKSNKKSSGFLPEEREWMSKWFDAGFLDSFRYLHKDHVSYSWWSFRANARNNNKGWRIDYQSITENLGSQLKEAYQIPEAKHSDHCPVCIKIST